ncbi:unnamed protein product [Arabis nemorensis]|uniref:RRM domain-containing protein n=1 Tax=Arabis nemorensis TaxID=586526 RepID=A0A565ALL8_9BRAS|nr:unnamed protein product [Arabis nemorensis]
MSYYSKRSRYSPSLSPYDKRRGRSISRSLSRSRSRSVSSDAENPGNSLYVTGLSHRVTERDLEDHFSKQGKVTDVHLVLDPWTRESRGFGFISMETVGDANRCIRYLDHSVLQGRVITVEKARRRRGRPPTPGKYLGLRAARGMTSVALAAIGLLATLPAGLLAALVVAVEATHPIEADHILQAIGGEDHHPTRLITGEADRTLIPDLHHLMIVTTGGATDPTHLTIGGVTGPGQGPTRLTTEHGTDHTLLTTGDETENTNESRYRSVSRSESPVSRSKSRSISPEKRRKESRSKSRRRDSQSSMSHSRSARSSTSRSVSP